MWTLPFPQAETDYSPMPCNFYSIILVPEIFVNAFRSVFRDVSTTLNMTSLSFLSLKS